jgi:DNA-binding LacI/PurR family transcriptional regulator
MRDVANAVGVSLQTVSAVINQKPGITQETSRRVLEAIEQLGYRPYAGARSLRTRRTRTIALIVSDIANSYLATMASAAEERAHDAGYSLVLYNTHDDVTRENNYVRTVTERWVDGVLFVSARDKMECLDTLIDIGIPLVAIDRIPETYTGPSVTLDNVLAGRMAAQHLIDLGHTRLAHITGPLRLRLARERLDGFRQAIGEAHLPEAIYVCANDWGPEDGLLAMHKLLALEPRPTAVFAANDRLAIGAIQAAWQTGLSVPRDLSMVGLDDVEFAAYQIPPLTTVRQSIAQIAVMGVDTLLAILDDREPAACQIVLPPTLVVRQSTARPNVAHGERCEHGD